MAFQNKVLTHKDFEYEITLRASLKEENEVFNVNGQRCFLIKTEKFIEFFREFETKSEMRVGGNAHMMLYVLPTGLIFI